ncbi:MAG: hypothetical protein JST61_00685 [Acidobacteria bacterium]|nr:hypothetical protein [Acidobacteriota bacterium]
MDQATLVNPDVSAGAQALAVLDKAGFKHLVALLAIFPEYEDWRMVISSPSLNQTQQLKAYEQVAEALQGRFVYTLPTIMVLPTKDPFIRELRSIFGRSKEVIGMRLGGQRIGNRFLSNAYVYRISPL